MDAEGEELVNRPSLTITRGLPASGKSSWANGQQNDNPDRIRIVTRDDIRASFGTQFPADEKLVFRIAEFAARTFLDAGYRVIVPDTNTSAKVVRRWGQLAKTVNVPFKIVTFDTPLEVCLKRNQRRWKIGDCKVPDSAIIEMNERWVR